MRTSTKLSIGSCLALLLATAVWSPVQANPGEPRDGVKLTDSKLAEHCKEMQTGRAKLNADVTAEDARITTQLAEMNSAAGDKKVDLMAVVVTRFVEQRISLDARRAALEGPMMQHMMQHMQSGKDSMPNCPMMKGDGETAPISPK